MAAIDNTVTVTATQPGGGAYTPAPTATESVDVVDDAPALDVVKAHTLTKGGGNTNTNAEVGDTINYTYTVTNTGNVTVTNVSIIDQHDFAASTSALPGVLEPTTVTDNQPGGPSAGQTVTPLTERPAMAPGILSDPAMSRSSPAPMSLPRLTSMPMAAASRPMATSTIPQRFQATTTTARRQSPFPTRLPTAFRFT